MAERRPVLLTVSGTIPGDLDQQVAEGRRPCADHRVLAAAMDADVVDVERALEATGRVGRVLRRVLGVGPLLAWYSFRRRRDYDVLLTDGEQVGLPLACLTRVFGSGGARHVMIVHILSVPKKVVLVKAARLARQIDRYVVYCTRQAEFVRDELGVPAAAVVVSTFMVDTEFFARDRAEATPRRRICSAGLERRDYPTLMQAVEGLDVEVVIAAASPWSKQPDSSADRPIPSNVEIRRLDLFELRELYASCAFAVMPLVDVEFQAGITTILEAMSMELPVVCTRTAGQTDTIVDGRTGIYVPPGDPVALRAAIERLLGDEQEVARIGREARRWVVANADVVRYADAVAAVVAGVSDRSAG
ncbi:MAG: glycosyltransferase family 4 protein [Ilumatobacter sp.]|uniref:glycosyltransferase family 4 protein n=1 Tax=Ilumatobacter sp. TaxID=1967498 RepID=UPI002609F0BF|nr:glycosyltransferase family 4 protein [Ilumatobacter sp.]MDJ0770832.1 glycosyltransferase family 4 protein [Ilumatobacter sp.]